MFNKDPKLSPNNLSDFQKNEYANMNVACEECIGRGHFGDMPKGRTTFVPCCRCSGTGYEPFEYISSRFERLEDKLGNSEFVVKEITEEYDRLEKAIKFLTDAGARNSNIKSLSEVRGFAIRVLQGKEKKFLEQLKNDPAHRKWRTLIRIEKIDKDNVYMVIPAWNHKKEIRVLRSTVPQEIQDKSANGFPVRCHARVNIGCKNAEGLCFSGWERN